MTTKSPVRQSTSSMKVEREARAVRMAEQRLAAKQTAYDTQQANLLEACQPTQRERMISSGAVTPRKG